MLWEQYAIEIMMKNIHNLVAILLKDFTIHTFQKFINKVESMQRKAKYLSFGDQQNRYKSQNILEKKHGSISSNNKGKQPIRERLDQH